MSAVTDRLTPEDIKGVARIIIAVRQRIAREEREAAENAAAAPARDGQRGGDHDDA